MVEIEPNRLLRLFVLLTALAFVVFAVNIFRPLLAISMNEVNSIKLYRIVQNVRYSLPQAIGGRRRRTGLNTTGGTYLMLDGKPFQIFSGSMHYFRVPHQYWKDRLHKLKAAGLNTVETYVPWNLHERKRGVFDFTNDEYDLDIAKFVELAKLMELYVIVRPGPYICSEWEWGGLPGWLLEDPKMVVRSLYAGFTDPVSIYLKTLADVLEPHLYTNDGPIIALQVENEYGSYGSDSKYLKWLRDQFVSVGLSEGLMTSDGSQEMYRGAIPGVFATVNFDVDANTHFNRLKKLRPNQPLMNMEFYSGWFDHWGERHHRVNTSAFEARLRASLEWTNSSVNIFMFHGGTNFGFWNGANRQFKFTDSDVYIYQPTITSYDYDAVLTESGQVTAKWHQTQELMIEFNPTFQPSKYPAPPANNPPVTSYNRALVNKYLTLTAMLVNQPSYHVKQPVFMESICKARIASEQEQANMAANPECDPQTVGFIVYRRNIVTTSVKRSNKKLRLEGFIHDRLMVLVDGRTVTYSNLQAENFEVTSIPKNISLNMINDGRTAEIIILVENMGRINYDRIPRKLDDQRKGFNGRVFYGADEKLGWDVFKLEFDRAMLTSLQNSSGWESGRMSPGQPALFAASLEIAEGDPEDTFIDTKKWEKGNMFVNKFNLGRYWSIMGPQSTLYVPAPKLIRGTNEIMAFELHNPHFEFTFTSHAVLAAFHEDLVK